MSRLLSGILLFSVVGGLPIEWGWAASGTVPGAPPFDTIVNAMGQASSGDVITVNNGTYVESAQIAIPAGVELVAANQGGATIVGVGDPMINMGENSRIAGFVIDGTNNFSSNSDGLGFTGVSGAVAEDLLLINQPLAILFNGDADGIVRRTVIESSGLLDKPGIRFNSGAHEVLLEDVEIRNHLSADIPIRVFPGATGSNVTCNRVTVNDHVDFAFLVESDTTTVTLNDCEFIGNGWQSGQLPATSALWLRGTNITANLTNTVIANSGLSGIRQDNGVTNALNLNHCVLYGNLDHGIVISDSPNSSVTNTIFAENGGWGIAVRDGQSPAAFSHCLTFNNGAGDFEPNWIPDSTFLLGQNPFFIDPNVPPRADPEGTPANYILQIGAPGLGSGSGGSNIGLEEGPLPPQEPSSSIENWNLY
jgi:hypothetical protein